MKTITTFTFFLLIFLPNTYIAVDVFSTGPYIVNAQGTNEPPIDGNGDNQPARTTKVVNPLTIDNLEELLVLILRTVVQVAIPFLVLAFMYVGFKFVAARGNTQELASARQAFFYTVIGTLLILGAQLIAEILSGTLKEITRDVF